MIGVSRSRYYDWIDRYGKSNEHNAQIPRDYWLEEWEKKAIIDYHWKNPLNGYRRLTYMMMDADIIAVAPSTTYRVLLAAGVLNKKGQKSSTKGKGFIQPDRPHKHWHIDISYINVCGTFFYLCSILDGYSRFIVNWELKESMTEADIELVIQKALDHYPGVKPRIISDNGPQFIANDFKSYIRLSGLTHVRTSPYYPQSNGKIERWHKELKKDCIRPKKIESYEDAVKQVELFVKDYNFSRPHSSLSYITPYDKLMGKEDEIFKSREEKLKKARDNRKLKRQSEKTIDTMSGAGYGTAGEQPERYTDQGEQEESAKKARQAS